MIAGVGKAGHNATGYLLNAAARPWRRRRCRSCCWCWCWRPCWYGRAVSAAGVQIGGAAANSAPDDHFAAGPHCRLPVKPGIRRANSAVVPVQLLVTGLYLPPVLREIDDVLISAPYYHFTASPHGRVMVPGSGRTDVRGGHPTVGAGIISAAGVRICRQRQGRPKRSFRCPSTLQCDRRAKQARWWCW